LNVIFVVKALATVFHDAKHAIEMRLAMAEISRVLGKIRAIRRFK